VTPAGKTGGKKKSLILGGTGRKTRGRFDRIQFFSFAAGGPIQTVAMEIEQTRPRSDVMVFEEEYGAWGIGFPAKSVEGPKFAGPASLVFRGG